MNEQEFAAKIISLGGKAYIVGGWVRDTLRGKEPQDKDYVIVGIEETMFCTAFPTAVKVGKSFPVYLVAIAGKNAEVAFARQETKQGSGYRGFRVCYAPTVTIEEDLYRRDTTMNSMAISLMNGELIDPYQGAAAIANREIRATSRHFADDPVRALRAARQAAQTGFVVTTATLALMNSCRRELLTEPAERIMGELRKALQSENPSLFFHCLQQAGLLTITYPEIAALLGKAQSRLYQPANDVFYHSLEVLDIVAMLTERLEVRFAALVHDLGKGMTRETGLSQYGHDSTGITALQAWNLRMTLPRLWLACANFVISQHERVLKLQTPGEIVDFLLALTKNPLGNTGFEIIIQADQGMTPKILQEYAQSMAAISSVKNALIPPTLSGKAIGEWIRQRQIYAYQNR